MTLNNTYTIKHKSITKVLNQIDSFITNMSKFTKDHLGYSYDLEIFSRNDFWVCEINIKNEKRENNKALRKII